MFSQLVSLLRVFCSRYFSLSETSMRQRPERPLHPLDALSEKGKAVQNSLCLRGGRQEVNRHWTRAVYASCGAHEPPGSKTLEQINSPSHSSSVGFVVW